LSKNAAGKRKDIANIILRPKKQIRECPEKKKKLSLGSINKIIS